MQGVAGNEYMNRPRIAQVKGTDCTSTIQFRPEDDGGFIWCYWTHFYIEQLSCFSISYAHDFSAYVCFLGLECLPYSAGLSIVSGPLRTFSEPPTTLAHGQAVQDVPPVCSYAPHTTQHCVRCLNASHKGCACPVPASQHLALPAGDLATLTPSFNK